MSTSAPPPGPPYEPPSGGGITEVDPNWPPPPEGLPSPGAHAPEPEAALKSATEAFDAMLDGLLSKPA